MPFACPGTLGTSHAPAAASLPPRLLPTLPPLRLPCESANRSARQALGIAIRWARSFPANPGTSVSAGAWLQYTATQRPPSVRAAIKKLLPPDSSAALPQRPHREVFAG